MALAEISPITHKKDNIRASVAAGPTSLIVNGLKYLGGFGLIHEATHNLPQQEVVPLALIIYSALQIIASKREHDSLIETGLSPSLITTKVLHWSDNEKIAVFARLGVGVASFYTAQRLAQEHPEVFSTFILTEAAALVPFILGLIYIENGQADKVANMANGLTDKFKETRVGKTIFKATNAVLDVVDPTINIPTEFERAEYKPTSKQYAFSSKI